MKNSKFTRVIIILLLLIILALAITAMVFFFMNKSNVNKLNDITQAKNDCETQIMEKDLKISELETTRDNLQKSLDDINNEEFSNFVYDYKKYSTDTVRITEHGIDKMGMSVSRNLDGNIEMCVYDKTYISGYSGEVSRENKPIDGLFGKVSKCYIYNLGNGINPQVLFLLENGKVQYIDTNALSKGNFIIGGTLDVEKVVDIIEVNVGYSGAGGHIAFATIDVNGNVKVFNELK